MLRFGSLFPVYIKRGCLPVVLIFLFYHFMLHYDWKYIETVPIGTLNNCSTQAMNVVKSLWAGQLCIYT